MRWAARHSYAPVLREEKRRHSGAFDVLWGLVILASFGCGWAFGGHASIAVVVGVVVMGMFGVVRGSWKLWTTRRKSFV